MNLKGKVALVTGAASGIGESVTTRLSELGAQVIANDIDGVKLAAAHAHRPSDVCSVNDISDLNAPHELMSRAIGTYGRVDILVNNAGIEGVRGELSSQTDENWRRVMDVNLAAVFRLCRAAAPALTASGAGRIINISSIVGMMAVQGASAYAASKMGVVGLTRVLALDLGRDKVTANCILPGMILTPINAHRDPARLKLVLERIPIGRFGVASDVANVAAFLASDDAGYVSGQTISVDGGWTVNL